MKKKIIGILVMMLMIMTGLSTIAVADDWPMFHHDLLNTGYSTSEAPEENILIWKYQKEGTIFSSPVVADGKVYVGSDDWNLYCLDADDGSKLWNYTTRAAVDSTPAVVDGKVYFGSMNHSLQVGFINCLDAEDGSKIWEYPTETGMDSAPAVVDGKVYINVWDGRLYCLA